MLEILEKITSGEGIMSDLEDLKQLAAGVQSASLCQLGKTSANPIITTLRYFEKEYVEHIEHKHCKAGVCKALIRFNIIDACKGCTRCAKKCPVGAISGEVKHKYAIDQEKCTHCGICYKECRFKAIERGGLTQNEYLRLR